MVLLCVWVMRCMCACVRAWHGLAGDRYDTDLVQDALGFNPSLDLPTGKLDSVRYVLAGA